MPVEDYSPRELGILFGALATFIQTYSIHNNWSEEQKQEIFRLSQEVEEELKKVFDRNYSRKMEDQEVYRLTTRIGMALVGKQHNMH